ncbi:Protein SET DOMAIN GROUP 40 [Tetrabaena socialis]|uniref:Protein SET DOMAIN GROUP 40 n=1 Tax=Tetrabaena socialis TaxID=47790 RepID=A0A2J7ZY36_9CHLO|nr:Protein SET DOMAIN GROUP 40 [Tetrabaena socialis]|eukprot:PNH05183.1 Protein SET DOMAIN GROUP 40 [Tetrabaena socialis]
MPHEELAGWCEQHGVVLNGIAAGFVEEGWRGVIATKDLAPDDVVLRVPERLLLTTRSAVRDPALAAALLRASAPSDPRQHPSASSSLNAGLSPHQVLACHLLLEVSRGAASFWWPYLRQLPRSYSSLPNFAAADAAELQLRHARDAAETAAERAEEEWRGALPVLQHLGLPKRFAGLRAWLWAACTLHSRTMYLPWCPAGALTPFGDLHNYQPPPPPYTPSLGGAPPGVGGAGVGVRGAGGSAGDAATAVSGGTSEGAAGGAAADQACGAQGAAAAAAAPQAVEASDGALLGTLPPLHALAVTDAATCAAAESSGEAFGALAACSSSLASEEGRAALTSTADGGDDGGCGIGPGCSGAVAVAVPPLSERPPGPVGAAVSLGCSKDGCSSTGGIARTDASGVEAVLGGGSGGRAESDGGRQGGASGAALDAGGGCTSAAEVGAVAAAPDEVDASIAGDGTWDEAAQQYCIIVRRPYGIGEQIMLCYGRHTNLELLEHYGFVLEANPHDTAPLDPALLPLPDSARYAPGAPPLAPADCFLHANGQPSWQLLHLLRYCAATPPERRSWGHKLAAGERVSQEGDRRVLSWLYAACSKQLTGMGTSLQHDQQLLQQQQQEQEQKKPAAEQQGQALRGPEVAEAQQQVDAAPAGSAALSDGLTCSGLALQWRILHKRTLLRAMSCAEAVLGPQQRQPGRLSLAELQRRLRPA